MWRKNAVLLVLMTITSILLTPNCATLTRRRTQRIPVTSFPAGATVIVNGRQQGVTPLEISLDRKKKGQVVRIESPGYNPLDIKLARRFSAEPAVGNVVMGAITGYLVSLSIWMAKDQSIDARALLVFLSAGIGLAYIGVDGATGTAYSLEPRDLVVTLKKTEGTSRVDTMLVDADDFANVKWIRIRKD